MSESHRNVDRERRHLGAVSLRVPAKLELREEIRARSAGGRSSRPEAARRVRCGHMRSLSMQNSRQPVGPTGRILETVDVPGNFFKASAGQRRVTTGSARWQRQTAKRGPLEVCSRRHTAAADSHTQTSHRVRAASSTTHSALPHPLEVMAKRALARGSRSKRMLSCSMASFAFANHGC